VAESGHGHTVSLGDGIYWALSTMTTVGYGDFVPHTTSGRIVAAVVMVMGVAFFAMITGAIAQRFLATEVEEIEEEMVEVEEMVHEAEQTERRVEAGEGQILQEIHELAERLQSLEDRLRGQFGARSG
jgi:voltage-gated potassium channel